MIAVLDVSAAFGLVRGVEKAKSIEDALETFSEIIAPGLFVYEALNAAWKYAKFTKLERADAFKIFDDACEFIDVFVDDFDLAAEAFELSLTHEHSSYDCFYLALALESDASLLTLDKKLLKVAESLGVGY